MLYITRPARIEADQYLSKGRLPQGVLLDEEDTAFVNRKGYRDYQIRRGDWIFTESLEVISDELFRKLFVFQPVNKGEEN